MRNVYMDKTGCGDKAFYVNQNPNGNGILTSHDLIKLSGGKVAPDEPMLCGACGRQMEAFIDPQFVMPEASSDAEQKQLDKQKVETFEPAEPQARHEIDAERAAEVDKVGEKIAEREEKAHEAAAEALADQQAEQAESEKTPEPSFPEKDSQDKVKTQMTDK